MTALAHRLRLSFANPVLRRELVERWRGRRAFWVVTAYVGVLTGVYLLLYWLATSFIQDRMRWGGFQAFAAGPTLGRFLFENLMAFVMLLVLFIAPGYAAAQISGERERRTLSLLQVTLVRPAAIVAGKLGASVAWLLLLVVVAVPFGAVAFFLGGVSLPDLVRGVLTTIVIAISVAGVSLGISSVTRRTTASVVLTYGLVLVLIVGSLFGALIEFVARDLDQDPSNRPVTLYANPFYGLADAVRANTFFSGSELPSVLTPFASVLPGSERQFVDQAIEVPAIGVGEQRGMIVVGDAPPFGRPERDPVWLATLAIYVVLGAAGFMVATRRVRAGHGPRRRDRRGELPATAPAPGVPPPPPPPPPPTA